MDKPDFRYDTFLSQQQALAALAKKTAKKATVVYASPAFYTNLDLFGAMNTRQLVQKSNFCEADKLSGHSRYSYIAPGNKGKAHSDSVPIESKRFDHALAELDELQPASSNLTYLAETAESIDFASKSLAEEVSQMYSQIKTSIFQEADSGLAQSLAALYAFQVVCNVNLLIGYQG